MADLTKFGGVVRRRPTESYNHDERIKWDRDSAALSAELDASEVARRESEALREQMTTQARRVAELEFEVARLTRLTELQPVETPDSLLAKVRAEAWDGGYRTCDQVWAETADITTPDEHRTDPRNPYRTTESEDD